MITDNTDTILIYRVENKQKFGPFHNGFFKDFYHHKAYCYSLPNLKNDIDCHAYPNFNYDNYQHYYTGLQNISLILEWFNPALNDLYSRGYYISVYLVKKSDIIFGNHQVLFDRDNSIFLGCGKLEDIEKIM